MKGLENNDWILLNSMIYDIYTTEDFDGMRQNFLRQLGMLMDFDSADFYLASSKEGRLLCRPVTLNCDPDLSQMYESLDYSSGVMLSGKALIYRESDIISEEARVRTEYYQKVYRPNNWHYALQMIMARDGKFLGVITFYRTIGKENFQYGDIFLLDQLKDHLTYRLFRQAAAEAGRKGKIGVAEAAAKYALTKRERTILRLLLDGKEREEICGELVITPNTLKKHILNMYRKMGIKNRTQLFKMIRESG